MVMMNPGKDLRPLIIHVVYRFDIGGLENGVVNLVNLLPREKFRHGIVSLTECNAAFCERISRKSVQCLPLEKPPGHTFKIYPQLYQLFKTYRPAIVHTRNLAALETVIPARFAGVPIRVHGEHGLEISDRKVDHFKNRFFRRLYRPFVTEYVALSGLLENYLIRDIGVSPKRVERICNGVDIQRFSPPPYGREMIEGSLFNPSSLIVVGTVGRLQPVKDQLTLVRAFARAYHAGTPGTDKLRLIIVGEGPLRRELEEEIIASGIGNQVWMMGAREDVPRMMRSFDLFVLPSRSEGISNTILEAMSSGLPVVATDVGGNGELVVSGQTGTLVPAEHPDAMAAAIAAYAASPEMREAHGRAGRRRVEAEFSIAGMVGRYEALYTRLLEDGKG